MHTLPPLGFAYDALEPHIDAQTMEIHHTKHHQGYVDKLNATVEKYPAIASLSLKQMLQQIDTLEVEEVDRASIRNNGGGHFNHTLFWSTLGPEKKINQRLVGEIEEVFGSLDAFKEQFTAASLSRFGSGWAWLVRNGNDSLQITSTPNQDSPLMVGQEPVFGIDVWEHAYYLKYQNRRAAYIDAWWNVLTVV